jgi:hypothetical protein
VDLAGGLGPPRRRLRGSGRSRRSRRAWLCPLGFGSVRASVFFACFLCSVFC